MNIAQSDIHPLSIHNCVSLISFLLQHSCNKIIFLRSESRNDHYYIIDFLYSSFLFILSQFHLSLNFSFPLFIFKCIHVKIEEIFDFNDLKIKEID